MSEDEETVADVLKKIETEITLMKDGSLKDEAMNELEQVKEHTEKVAVMEASPERVGSWRSEDHSKLSSEIKREYSSHLRVKSGIIHRYNEHLGYWEVVPQDEFKAAVFGFCKEHYFGSLKSGIVNSVFDLAKMELIADKRMFESQDEKVIVFSNCEVHGDDNGNWTKHDHAAKNYRISGIQAEYDPTAECPVFMNFMDQTFANTENPETLKQRVMELMGMTLISSNQDAQIIFLDGVGSNGKGTLQHLMEDILGTEACVTMAPDAFNVAHNIAMLYGKLMVLCGDVAKGVFIDDGMVKQISGGDTVLGKSLYKDPFAFKPQSTIWMAGNNGLQTKDTSHAMLRRINVVPFPNVVSEKDRDMTLGRKLKEEVPGIVNVILKAYGDKCKRGMFTDSIDVNRAREVWKTDNNICHEFAEDAIKYKAGSKVPQSQVYSIFKMWCDERGYRSVPNSKTFRKELASVIVDNGITVDNRSGGTYVWKGMAPPKFDSDEFDVVHMM